MENDVRTNRELTKEQLEAKNLGLLVYTSILRGDSYSSYEDRVLMLKKMGVFLGTSNHSAAFPPQFVKACFNILKGSIVSYSKYTSEKLKFHIPFSITVDKDTSKHRSRQVGTRNITKKLYYSHCNAVLQTLSPDRLGEHAIIFTI
jgi:hypothetical protein